MDRDKRLFVIGLLVLAFGLFCFVTIYGEGLTPAQRELMRKIEGRE